MKNCVVIGPTEINRIKKFGSTRDVKKYLDEAAVFFAKNFGEMIIVPDAGLPLEIAKRYKRINRKGKITGYIPDKTGGRWHLKKYYKFCDRLEKINGGWSKLNTEITQKSNCIFCLGLSGGVFIELGSIKYNYKYLRMNQLVFIDRRNISRELPPELTTDLKSLTYFKSFEKVDKLLK